jgi:cobalamin biosynthesis protein CbiG
MEVLLLTCLQANLAVKRVYALETLTDLQKEEIVFEIKKVSKKKCFIDAKAD